MKKFLLQIMKSKDQRGMAILYAVITAAAVITIGASIVGIYQRQSLLVSSSEASSRAFYAADAALECALKWDDRGEEGFAGGASTIECAGDNSVAVNSCSGDCNYAFRLDDTGGANVCAEVEISKDFEVPDYQQVVASGGSTYDINVSGVDYRVHIFYSSGSFLVSSGGQIEYLVVAGGGGGGSTQTSHGGGGGGGAGGMRTGTTDIGTGNNSIVVGGGGSGGAGNAGARGGDGGYSSIPGITSTGGGGGGDGYAPTTNGKYGGSGGGAGNVNWGCTYGGSGVSGQGYSGGGGCSWWPVRMSPGGGGGRGGSGTTFTSTDANYIGRNLAPGGPGLSSSITGSPITYAAGGPSGSTAPGCCSNQGRDGTNNRGNGGEGAYWNARGGHGGSGIVVVRYRLYDPIVNVEPIPTQIEVRGRNTCEPNSRQAERALRTAY